MDSDKTENIIIQRGRHSPVALLSVYSEKVILAFKGTSSLHDWLINAKLWMKSEKNGGRVHCGFQQELDVIWDEVETNLNRFDGLEIFYTGHSLGGALTTIAAARRPPTLLSTFGAPRVGDRIFNETMDRNKWFRVVRSGDPVPRIPPQNFLWSGYEHGGRLIIIEDDWQLHEVNEKDYNVLKTWFVREVRRIRTLMNSSKSFGSPIKPRPMIVETDLPELEIPASAGFTGHFQHIHERPISDNDLILPWLEKHASDLPPPYLFELARRIFSHSPEKSVEYFFLATIRIRYDAFRCKDKSAHQVVNIWPQIAGSVVEFMLHNPDIAASAGLAALDKEKKFPDDNSPEWVCHHGMDYFIAGMEKKNLTDWHVPESEWPRIREEARSDFAESLRELLNSSSQ